MFILNVKFSGLKDFTGFLIACEGNSSEVMPSLFFYLFTHWFIRSHSLCTYPGPLTVLVSVLPGSVSRFLRHSGSFTVYKVRS